MNSNTSHLPVGSSQSPKEWDPYFYPNTDSIRSRSGCSGICNKVDQTKLLKEIVTIQAHRLSVPDTPGARRKLGRSKTDLSTEPITCNRIVSLGHP